MIFVQTFGKSETWEKASKDIKEYMDCGGTITVERVGGQMRIEIEVDSAANFLHCIADYVGEHQLAAWEEDVRDHQDEMAVDREREED